MKARSESFNQLCEKVGNIPIKPTDPYGISRGYFELFGFEDLRQMYFCWGNYHIFHALLGRMNPDEILAFLCGGIPLKKDKETVGSLVGEQRRLDDLAEDEKNSGMAKLGYKIIRKTHEVGYRYPVVLAVKTVNPEIFPRTKGALEERVVDVLVSNPGDAEDFVNHALWPIKLPYDPNSDGRSRTLYITGPHGLHRKLVEMANANQ